MLRNLKMLNNTLGITHASQCRTRDRLLHYQLRSGSFYEKSFENLAEKHTSLISAIRKRLIHIFRAILQRIALCLGYNFHFSRLIIEMENSL